MNLLTSPNPLNWEIERAILAEAATFPASGDDIACFERRIAFARQTRPLVRLTISGVAAARANAPSKIAA
jgi:hypothetical protein